MRPKTYDRYRGVRIAVLRNGPLLAACIALLTLFYFLVPGFLGPGNMLDLMQQIAVNAIIAFGLTLRYLSAASTSPWGPYWQSWGQRRCSCWACTAMRRDWAGLSYPF